MNKTSTLNKTVFIYSSLILIAIVGVSALYPNSSSEFFVNLQTGLVNGAGWFYVLVVAILLVSILFFALSRYGDIMLGPDHAQPDYSGLSWFAMLFSAGIGIGLLFFGVAEPIMHYVSPPNGAPETVSAAKEAMNLTFFHWGLHAWAIYGIVGLALSYYGYRHNAPLTLRSTLYPILGKKINGKIGNMVDIFAILGTILGVATSLGYGVAQINAGLGYLLGMKESLIIQLVIITIITLLAMASVMSGLDKGIRRLSEVNMGLAFGLLLLILIVGPSLYLMQTMVQNTGTYLSDLINKTFNLYAYEPTDWFGGWTIFYWCWWISWSPFVGMFIARISRGRTIREFVLGVLFVPAGFTFLWMTVFGNSAINIVNTEGMALAESVQDNNAVALFKFLEYFPMSELVSGIAIVMIVIFFVTSADSGALVVNMLSSKGEDNTPAWQRVYWTSSIGLVAAILLVAGGLSALQTATIVSAFPFSVVLLLIIFALGRSLSIDHLKKQSLMNTMNTTPVSTHSDEQQAWVERIDNIASMPKAQRVKDFIKNTAIEALTAVSEAMNERGYSSDLHQHEDSIELKIFHGQEIDFIYRIKLRRFERPGFTFSSKIKPSETNQDFYYRAEVYLREGGQNYDVMGYNKEQIINDVLDQYEKHRHFLDLIR